jgi:hypothetical protein
VSYANYIKDYDRKAYGAGSDKKPPTDRFSGLDVRKMFDARDKYGKSEKEAAQMVLDYAEKIKGKSKMGGATRDALDKLRGYLKEEPKEEPKNTDRPQEVREDQERFEETRLDLPENQMPRMEDAYKPTQDSFSSGFDDGSMGAIRAGDDLNEWYQTKFVPHLEADANATNSEIGDDSRYFLSKFAFEPPELGDIGEIFDRYKAEIEDLD